MSTSTPEEGNEQNSELVIAITPSDRADAAIEEENAAASSSRRVRVMSLPAITSGHQTQMPATASFAVLSQSFGPSIDRQPSLWGESGTFELITPDGVLRIQGASNQENSTLQHYIAQDLAPDGLKVLAGFLEVYHLLTHGREQKEDVVVTARQVLQRLGLEEHADDNDTQQLVLNTALYLARTFVISLSSLTPQTLKRYTPLLVIEGVIENTADASWSIQYHLGQDFYDALYGKKPSRYQLPTARVMGYHSVKSQHELLLTFYLGNRLALGGGQTALYFTTLCVQSAIYTPAELQVGAPGKNRTRNAQQVIYALERLEQDGLIVRDDHPDVDLVLAVNWSQEEKEEKEKAKLLAPATRTRIASLLRSLKAYSPKELAARRRQALQRLLNLDMSREEEPHEFPGCTRLTFHAGPLLLSRQEEDTREKDKRPQGKR